MDRLGTDPSPDCMMQLWFSDSTSKLLVTLMFHTFIGNNWVLSETVESLMPVTLSSDRMDLMNPSRFISISNPTRTWGLTLLAALPVNTAFVLVFLLSLSVSGQQEPEQAAVTGHCAESRHFIGLSRDQWGTHFSSNPLTAGSGVRPAYMWWQLGAKTKENKTDLWPNTTESLKSSAPDTKT